MKYIITLFVLFVFFSSPVMAWTLPVYDQSQSEVSLQPIINHVSNINIAKSESMFVSTTTCTYDGYCGTVASTTAHQIILDREYKNKILLEIPMQSCYMRVSSEPMWLMREYNLMGIDQYSQCKMLEPATSSWMIN